MSTERVGYRYWYAFKGSWLTSSGHAVNADCHLGSPHIGLTAAPRIEPSINNLWTSSTASAVNCHAGCAASPGPCGMCGFSVVLDHADFCRLFAYRLARGLTLKGVDTALVAGQVLLHDEPQPTHPRLSNKLGVQEHRVQSLTMAKLMVASENQGLISGLQDRYHVSITTGRSPISLTHPLGL